MGFISRLGTLALRGVDNVIEGLKEATKKPVVIPPPKYGWWIIRYSCKEKGIDGLLTRYDAKGRADARKQFNDDHKGSGHVIDEMWPSKNP